MARSARWFSPAARTRRRTALKEISDASAFAGGEQGKAEGHVTLVGAGPGDPDLLTVKALRALQDADIVFYDELVSPEVLDRARRDAARLPVGRRVGKPGIGQDAINKLLIEAAQSGQRAVRLKGGDPFIFGRGGEEIEALRAAGVAYSVVPGITAGLGAAAQFEAPLTYRQEALRITFLTAHKARDAEAVDWSVLTDDKMTVVVYMGMTAAPAIRAGLLAAGRSPRTPVGVFARVTRPDAQAVVGTLADLPALVERIESGPAVLVIGDVVAHSAPWRQYELNQVICNCWKPPNDLPTATENQDHGSVDGDRQPHLGRRRDLSHRLARLDQPTSPTPPSSAPRMKRARCWRSRSPMTSARSAPISRRSKSGMAARSSPGNLREHIRSEGLTIDLPVPA